MKKKVRRFIKKHLLSWLLNGVVVFGWFGVYVLIKDAAFAERGYCAFGGEDFLMLLVLVILHGIKYLIRQYGREDNSK